MKGYDSDDSGYKSDDYHSDSDEGEYFCVQERSKTMYHCFMKVEQCIFKACLSIYFIYFW